MPKSSKQFIGKSAGMKLSNTTIIQIGVLVIGIVIAIGIVVYFTSYKPGIAISPELPTNFQKTINNFVIESLKDDYLPATLSFREVNIRPAPKDITYTANWAVRNIPLTSSYNSNNEIEFLTIVASVPAKATLNDRVSSSLANKFFKNFKEDWKCTTIRNYSFCESFWVENGNKRSVFVFTPIGKGGGGVVSESGGWDSVGGWEFATTTNTTTETQLRSKTLVVSCLVPDGSEFYGRNSCVIGE